MLSAAELQDAIDQINRLRVALSHLECDAHEADDADAVEQIQAAWNHLTDAADSLKDAQ